MEQYELLPFLERYDTVLFDLDGVMSSEEMYWNCAALTVYEMYFSERYYGRKVLRAQEAEEKTAEIRRLVFCDDRMIRMLKEKGVNSNWDLAYLVLGEVLCTEGEADFEQVLRNLEQISGDAFDCFREVSEGLSKRFGGEKKRFERLGTFWTEAQTCFQEWFLGDDLFHRVTGQAVRLTGKSGMVLREEPLVDKSRLQTLLRLLRDSGKRLGVGSGRPWTECERILEAWDIMQYFAPECVISYDAVMEAEKAMAKQGIRAEFTKPHPFMFLKGNSGGALSDLDIYRGNYSPADCKRTLVVGDAGADLFAARAAGCDFAAVLTGIHGKEARGFFETEKADYILEDVLAMMRKQS